MSGTGPKYYLPSTEQVAKLTADTREVIARAVVLLKSHPKPDTFAGRKTQEPFAQEKDFPPAVRELSSAL